MIDSLTIDPSFTRTGVYFFSTDPVVYHKIQEINKTYSFIFKGGNGFKFESGHYFASMCTKIDEATFPSLLPVVNVMSDNICLLVKTLKPKIFISEYPPPIGQWAPGLFMLDQSIVEKITDLVEAVYLIPPNGINSYMGARKVSKSFIVNRCKKDLEIKLRVNHDECSAFYLKEIVKRKIEGLLSKQTIFKMDNRVMVRL